MSRPSHILAPMKYLWIFCLAALAVLAAGCSGSAETTQQTDLAPAGTETAVEATQPADPSTPSPTVGDEGDPDSTPETAISDSGSDAEGSAEAENTVETEDAAGDENVAVSPVAASVQGLIREIVLQVDEFEPTVASAADCYAGAFTSVIPEPRLEDVWEAAESDYDRFADGIPLDLLTLDEQESFLAAADPCMEVWGTSPAYIDYLVGSLMEDLTPELMLTDDLEAGMSVCAADLNTPDLRLRASRSVLFALSDQEYVANTLLAVEVCQDSFVLPWLVESMVVESGLDRAASECVAPQALALTMEVFESAVESGGDITDGDASAPDMLGLMLAYIECGATAALR